MKSSEIDKKNPVVITQDDRGFYRQYGYLVLPELVKSVELAKLSSIVIQIIERSRSISRSNGTIDLEKGHSAASPRLRRVACAEDDYEALWNLCADSVITDVAMDLLGDNVRFRDLMLNFKWLGGGAEVKWHQDFAFYPHTHTGTLQFLLFLENVSSEQGPLQIVPGSHLGKVFEHYDDNRNWTGTIRAEDLAQCNLESAVEVIGAAGLVSVHHSCAIHGSSHNMSDKARPAFVLTYSAADAIAYTAPPYPGSHYGEIVRGGEPGYAHHEELMVPMPPDWSGGYTSIYSHQETAAEVN